MQHEVGLRPFLLIMALLLGAALQAVFDVEATEAQLAKAKLDAELLEAQNRIDAAREEQAERRNARRGQTGEGSLVAQLLQMSQQREQQLQQELAQTRNSLLEAVRSEITTTRQQLEQIVASQKPPDTLAQVRGLTELWQALQALMPPQQQLPPSNNFQEMLALARLQSDERRQEAEMALRRASTEAERELQREKINNERMRMAGIAQLVDRYLNPENPNTIGAAVVDRVAGRAGAPAPPPVAGNVQQQPAQPEAIEAECFKCDQVTIVPAGQAEFRCANCGELNAVPGVEPPAVSPQPEAAPVVATVAAAPAPVDDDSDPFDVWGMPRQDA